MKFINYNNNEFNIIHFQGKSKREKSVIFDEIFNNSKKLKSVKDLTILTIFTEDVESKLYELLKRNNIDIINCYIPNNKPWVNQYKLVCIADALKNVKTKYVLILDGGDVLVLTFNNMINKFKKYGYKLLFNATKNNWPNTKVDSVPNRDIFGDYKYFNAGCCLAYTKDALKFYTDCLKYYPLENPLNSEQLIVRYNFANYSKDPLQKYVFFDYKCEIFQTVGASELYYVGNDTVKVH